MSWTLLGKDTKSSLLNALVNILDGGSKFFNKKLPSHDAFHIKVVIGKIFVVGINHYLLSHKYVFELLESFDEG